MALAPSSAICAILARGGSKGLPGKNVRPFAGRPLIAWSIAQAHAAQRFGLVAVSTDCADIAAAARAAGADLIVQRPADLASDTATSIDALRHCLAAAEAHAGRIFDPICLLQPTSPLRTAQDICGALDLLAQGGAACVVSAMESKASPYFNLIETDAAGQVGLSKPLPAQATRRQDAPRVYALNGAIYVWTRDGFNANPAVLQPTTRLFLMPEARSADIDTLLDFDMAEFLFVRQNLAGSAPD